MGNPNNELKMTIFTIGFTKKSAETFFGLKDIQANAEQPAGKQ